MKQLNLAAACIAVLSAIGCQLNTHYSPYKPVGAFNINSYGMAPTRPFAR